MFPHGIGMSEDSVSYLSAAGSLHDSCTMLDVDGTPFVAWAPLYSLLIAAMDFFPVHLEYMLAAFNLIVYFLALLLSWMLIRQSLTGDFFRIACFATLIFSFTLLEVYARALSESFFLMLMLLFMLKTSASREGWGMRDYILIGVICSLAILTRYAGIILIPVFFFLYRSDRSKRSDRYSVQYILLFIVISMLPIIAWLARNWFMAETFTGFRPMGHHLFLKNIAVLADTFTSWIFPIKIPLTARLAMFIPVIFFLIRGVSEKTKLHAAVIAIYFIFLVLSYALFSMEEPRDRLLSPLFIPFFILLFSGLEKLIGEISKSNSLIVKLPSILVAVWLIYPVARTIKHVRLWHDEGVEVYNHPSWKHSETIAWLKENELPGKIFSNDAHAIYYFAGMNADRIPKSIYSFEEFGQSARNGGYLVWWNDRYLHDLDMIRKKYSLEHSVTLADGAIYEMRPL